MKRVALFLAFAATVCVNAQVVNGQTDTFSANTMNWQGAQPTWVSTGGPSGAGDGFLQLTSTGTSGPSSRMAGYNSTQWSGNYTGAGVGVISADLRNLGNTNLEMRLVFFDSSLSTQWVSNASFVLNANSLWNHVSFTIDQSLFTQTEGTTTFANTMLSVNRMMFRHDPGAPSNSGVQIAATLGIDNVHASPVPEPASLIVVGAGLVAALRRRARR